MSIEDNVAFGLERKGVAKGVRRQLHRRHGEGQAHLIGFDRHLEEAAMDLGANEWATFRKNHLAALGPAILATSLLGFALSIDDFVITYFAAGGEQTFPVFVWGIARVAIPPQVKVVASAIFLVAIGLALGNVIWQMRAARRERGAPVA